MAGLGNIEIELSEDVKEFLLRSETNSQDTKVFLAQFSEAIKEFGKYVEQFEKAVKRMSNDIVVYDYEGNIFNLDDMANDSE